MLTDQEGLEEQKIPGRDFLSSGHAYPGPDAGLAKLCADAELKNSICPRNAGKEVGGRNGRRLASRRRACLG